MAVIAKAVETKWRTTSSFSLQEAETGKRGKKMRKMTIGGLARGDQPFHTQHMWNTADTQSDVERLRQSSV